MPATSSFATSSPRTPTNTSSSWRSHVGWSRSLYHEQTTLPVSADLAGFADGQRANAASGRVARSDPHGLHFTAKAPARAYLVDNAYVIVEDGPDVTWVSVYPVAAYVAR